MLAYNPRLRSHLAVAEDDSTPGYFFLWDRLGLNDRPQRLNALEFLCVQMLDGQHSLHDIQMLVMQRADGRLVPLEVVHRVVEKLDAALFLDGPRFRDAVERWTRAPVRQPRCIGCYEGDPVVLRRQLENLFTGPRGSALPRQQTPDGRLRAALIPHIDYARGGATYTWGFKEVFERSDASLFVIIGTSHYSPERFTLTRKDFQTPLGVTPTDQGYIDRLVRHFGDEKELFKDELAHLPEHSIELEVVFLQYLYEGRRPIRIVPLLVGSFQDCVCNGAAPTSRDDIGRMIEALRRTEAETAEPICYLISGDLAHIGPKFGDFTPVREPALSRSRGQDQAILRKAEAADPAGFFGVIADESDARRICGLPPTYTVLEAVRPRQGKVLHYDQYVHPRGFESVSFASMAFYR